MKEIKMFMAYASEDEEYKQQLSKHLSALKEEGYISEWTVGEILPGANVMSDLRKRMSRCDIVALLLSADFVGSDDGIELEEMAFALKAKKGTRLVPIKIRACMLSDAYAQFSMLPDQSKPVDDPAWGSRDNAYMNIAEGLKKLALSMREEEARSIRGKIKQNMHHTAKAASTGRVKADGPHRSGSNKKAMMIGIGVLVALVLAVGGFMLMHDDSPERNPKSEQLAVKPVGNSSASIVGSSGGSGSDTDAGTYDHAKTQNTSKAFAAYLQNFPEGKYRTEAEDFMKRLKNDEDWVIAKKSNDLLGYQVYVRNNPDGSHIEEANEKIEQLKIIERDKQTWEKASKTNTVAAYIGYLKEFSPGIHHAEAIAGIKPLLTSQGWAYYGKLNADDKMNGSRYFDLLEGEKDGNPKVGDLVKVTKGINIRRGPNADDATIKSLRKDQIGMVSEIRPGVWVKISY